MAVLSDPIRLEVLKNALESIADGMAITVVRTSRSSVVRQGLDFSTGLLSSQGELVGQSHCFPMHLGGMTAALEACFQRYQGRIEPGDILINNDPYEGASHLPDIFLFKPMFEGDLLLGYLCAMTHHTDVGGRVPGGNASDSTEIYQEGIRIPPLKLYQRGEPNETLFRIIEKAVRVPDKVLADLSAQVAALHYGEHELMRLVGRYGAEDLVSHQAELLDYTEQMARSAIRRLPDGEWSFTDYVDDDGLSDNPIKIAVNLTKKDAQFYVDFTGTSPQCKGAIQPMFATTKAGVYAAARTALGEDIPNTGGYFRAVTVTAPEGTFVNPLPPAPVAARAVGYFRLVQAVLGAFAQMLPHRIFACSGGCELGVSMAGYDQTKTPWKPWVQLDFQNETAWGASPNRDGFDGQGTPTGNQSIIPVETMEAEHPIKIDEYSFAPDSEGAGSFRGGMGLVRTYHCLMDETLVQMRTDRMRYQPYGLYGGQGSAPTKITITSGDKVHTKPSKFLVTLNKGDVVRVASPGGGGWGDPLERQPELVLKDVVSQLVTLQRARQVYGVVVNVERREVDFAATAKLREELRGSSKPHDTPRVAETG